MIHMGGGWTPQMESILYWPSQWEEQLKGGACVEIEDDKNGSSSINRVKVMHTEEQKEDWKKLSIDTAQEAMKLLRSVLSAMTLLSRP